MLKPPSAPLPALYPVHGNSYSGLGSISDFEMHEAVTRNFHQRLSMMVLSKCSCI